MKPVIKKRAKRADGDASSAKALLRIKSILVPIDFSELSGGALAYAATFAKRVGTKLTLLHVVEPMTVATDFPYSYPLVMDHKQVVAHGKRRLEQFAKKLGIAPRLIATSVVAEGRSFHEITEAARTLESDLIIISTHGNTGFKRVLLGSTSEHVVRHAPCPVLVLRQPKKVRGRGKLKSGLHVRKILAPVDFSEFSLDALNHAIAYAKKFGAALTLLNAVHPTFYFTAADDEAVLYAELMADACRESERQMGKLLKERRMSGLKVRGVVHRGDPRNEILATATREGADLIVLATHGRTGLKHVLLGSVAEYVVRQAPCGVLVVRQRKL